MRLMVLTAILSLVACGDKEEDTSVEEVEEGNKLQPKFDSQGLIPAITVEYSSNEINSLIDTYESSKFNKEITPLDIISVNCPLTTVNARN